MYDNFPNQGMRCIHQLLAQQQAESPVELTCDVFDVRGKLDVPGLDYDIYISSGGPGSPLACDEPWEAPYFELIDRILDWNRTNKQKKHLLLICHSFQLVSRHLGVGTLSRRRSTSFGIFPIHLTAAGRKDPLFQGLNDPFLAVDSRDYQVTRPDAAPAQRTGRAGAGSGEKPPPRAPGPRHHGPALHAGSQWARSFTLRPTAPGCCTTCSRPNAASRSSKPTARRNTTRW